MERRLMKTKAEQRAHQAALLSQRKKVKGLENEVNDYNGMAEEIVRLEEQRLQTLKALRDIEQEVRDDFPNLPFDFRIRLLGNDLAIAGITQNQRPGKVDIKQKPLGDILAQIMLQANPDKSATSPADPNCKLIYIIGDDPDDPTRQAVLVTTREAAENRKQPLPVVFQTGE